MKKKLVAACLVLLSLPFWDIAVRDIVVRVLVATHTGLTQTTALVTPGGYEDTVEGDEESYICTLAVLVDGHNTGTTYIVPCNEPAVHSGSGQAQVGVLWGLFAPEVVTVGGHKIWHGEPSTDIGPLTFLLYAVSYLAALLLVAWLLVKKFLSKYEFPTKEKPQFVAVGVAAPGALVAAVLAAGLPVWLLDPMIGMALGFATTGAFVWRLHTTYRKRALRGW